MTDDAAFLRRYAEHTDESAFAEFVSRRLGLVYGAAVRRTGDDQRAREVAQMVFTDAARRAKALALHPSIAGWLYTATRNASINLLRAEIRRRNHERAAHEFMVVNRAPSDVDWSNIQDVLDRSLDQLNKTDRDAVLVRFFEGRSYVEIAERLGIAENAARMRVSRALEKLRSALERNGVNSTAAALASVLANQAIAAPASLAASIAHTALVASAASSASSGLLATLTMKKSIAALTGVLLVGALIPPALRLNAHQSLLRELDRLNADRTEIATADQRARAIIAAGVASGSDSRQVDELTRLRARIATLKARPDGVLDAEMRPPRDVGAATPEASFETLCWAIDAGDWETLSKLIVLEGDTGEKVATGFANLPPEIRQKYGTPERWLAHAWMTAMKSRPEFSFASIQILGSQIIDGGPALRRVTIWQRTGAGTETSNTADFQNRPGEGGWMISAAETSSAIRRILPRVDTTTGEVRPHNAR